MHPVLIQRFKIEYMCRVHHFICNFYFIPILLAFFYIKSHASCMYSIFFKTDWFCQLIKLICAFVFPATFQF